MTFNFKFWVFCVSLIVESLLEGEHLIYLFIEHFVARKTDTKIYDS